VRMMNFLQYNFGGWPEHFIVTGAGAPHRISSKKMLFL